jgi:hypothetical protein
MLVAGGDAHPFYGLWVSQRLKRGGCEKFFRHRLENLCYQRLFMVDD